MSKNKDIPAEWVISFGDTTVELTEPEVRMGAVKYLFRPITFKGDREPMTERYATPIEIECAIFPDINFQVSPEGYETMRAKAKRIVELQRKSGRLR